MVYLSGDWLTTSTGSGEVKKPLANQAPIARENIKARRTLLFKETYLRSYSSTDIKKLLDVRKIRMLSLLGFQGSCRQKYILLENIGYNLALRGPMHCRLGL